MSINVYVKVVSGKLSRVYVNNAMATSAGVTSSTHVVKFLGLMPDQTNTMKKTASQAMRQLVIQERLIQKMLIRNFHPVMWRSCHVSLNGKILRVRSTAMSTATTSTRQNSTIMPRQV